MSSTEPWSFVFVLRDLGIGGAERVVVRLANYAARQGIDTHLITLVGSGPLAAELSADVTLHDLQAARIRSAALPYFRLLRQLRPRVVMSTLPQVNALTVLITRFLPHRPRVLLREANDPRFEAPYSIWFGNLKRRLLALAYRRADAVVAVSEGVKQGVEEEYRVQPTKVVSIPNASLDDAVLAKAEVELADDWYERLTTRIVSVARLSPQKDHASLLRAFGAMNPDVGTGLVLIGSGPLETKIRQQIDDLGLGERVRLVTDESNPFRWLRAAQLLVLSSRWEGSPNVLVEAMALGVPVVSTDCPSGPREILLGGRLGPLVPVGDSQALALAMRQTLARPVNAENLVERSRDFHIERVGPSWIEAARSA